MVNQLDWHSTINFWLTLTQGQGSNFKVKQEIRYSWVHISKPVWPTDLILGTKTQPNKAQLMTQVPMTLTFGLVKVKCQKNCQNLKKNGPYLECYFTYRLHTWYQEIRCSWVHISKPIWPTEFILGTKLQPNKVHSMTLVPMTLTQGQGQRPRSNFPQNG